MRTYEIRTQTLTEQPAAAMTATLTTPEIGPWLATVYAQVAHVLARSAAGPLGPPFARYHRLGEDRFRVEGAEPDPAAWRPEVVVPVEQG